MNLMNTMVNMFLFLAVLSADGSVGGGNQALRLHQADVRGGKISRIFHIFSVIMLLEKKKSLFRSRWES